MSAALDPTARVDSELGTSSWHPVTQDECDRVRLRVRVDGVEVAGPATTLTLTLTFERKGGDKPVCVAQTLYRLVEDDR